MKLIIKFLLLFKKKKSYKVGGLIVSHKRLFNTFYFTTKKAEDFDEIFTLEYYNVSAMSSGGFGTTHYQITENDNRKHKR